MPTRCRYTANCPSSPRGPVATTRRQCRIASTAMCRRPPRIPPGAGWRGQAEIDGCPAAVRSHYAAGPGSISGPEQDLSRIPAVPAAVRDGRGRMREAGAEAFHAELARATRRGQALHPGDAAPVRAVEVLGHRPPLSDWQEEPARRRPPVVDVLRSPFCSAAPRLYLRSDARSSAMLAEGAGGGAGAAGPRAPRTLPAMRAHGVPNLPTCSSQLVAGGDRARCAMQYGEYVKTAVHLAAKMHILFRGMAI